MMAPTHVATASIVTYGLFGFDWKVLAVASIAALLPDLDNTKSVLGRIFFPISIPLNAVLGHRTLTHSLIGLIGTSILIYLTGSVSILIAWAIGYGSHLLLDRRFSDSGHGESPTPGHGEFPCPCVSSCLLYTSFKPSV